MKEAEYKEILQRYIDSIVNDVKKVQIFNVPEFKTLTMQCADIDKKTNSWVDCLTREGVKDTSRILYYFKVISNHSYQFIQQQVKSYKDTHKKNQTGYRALSRINNMQNVPVADTLYVGKSYSDFYSRFKHHLGLYNDDMYSLQLNYWAAPIELDLVMYYSIIEMEKEDLRFLEQLESALHYQLKPILGRSGH